MTIDHDGFKAFVTMDPLNKSDYSFMLKVALQPRRGLFSIRRAS